MNALSQVTLYSFISGFALLLGCFGGIVFSLSKNTVALIMAFGCGVLISAVSIDLMTEAFDKTDSPFLLGSSLMAGALLFVVGDSIIDHCGGEHRKKAHHCPDEQYAKSGNAFSILLGTLLDGIPESLVLGASIATGNAGGYVFVIAVFLSNFPEGISGTIAMRNAGISTKTILLIWATMVVITVVSAISGYYLLGAASEEFNAIAMAFASGAILAMLSDSMLPESFKEGGRLTGLFVVGGFLTAFLLSKLV